MIHFVDGFSIFSACLIRTASGSDRVFVERSTRKANPVATAPGSDKHALANWSKAERVRGNCSDQLLTLTPFPGVKLPTPGPALTAIERNERL
jgi:hypothetical protein